MASGPGKCVFVVPMLYCYIVPFCIIHICLKNLDRFILFSWMFPITHKLTSNTRVQSNTRAMWNDIVDQWIVMRKRTNVFYNFFISSSMKMMGWGRFSCRIFVASWSMNSHYWLHTNNLFFNSKFFVSFRLYSIHLFIHWMLTFLNVSRVHAVLPKHIISNGCCTFNITVGNTRCIAIGKWFQLMRSITTSISS